MVGRVAFARVESVHPVSRGSWGAVAGLWAERVDCQPKTTLLDLQSNCDQTPCRRACLTFEQTFIGSVSRLQLNAQAARSDMEQYANSTRVTSATLQASRQWRSKNALSWSIVFVSMSELGEM